MSFARTYRDKKGTTFGKDFRRGSFLFSVKGFLPKGLAFQFVQIALGCIALADLSP